MNEDIDDPICEIFIQNGFFDINWEGICKECKHGPIREECEQHKRYGCYYHDGDFFFARKAINKMRDKHD